MVVGGLVSGSVGERRLLSKYAATYGLQGFFLCRILTLLFSVVAVFLCCRFFFSFFCFSCCCFTIISSSLFQ